MLVSIGNLAVYHQSMTAKHKHRFINRYILSILAIILIAAATYAGLVAWRKYTEAAKPPIKAAAAPEFAFAGTEGWRQGPTNHDSMALFHDEDDGCFVSVQHKTGTIAADKAKRQKANESLTIKPGKTQQLIVQTPAGKQHYDLQQSTIVNPDNTTNPLMGGLETGYLQQGSGFLFFEGHCNKSSQLQSTIPALEAIVFAPN